MLLALAVSASGATPRRLVVIKADGLPGGMVEQMLADGKLPVIERVFVRGGAVYRNFYCRGVSVSASSWAVIETGREMTIRGNVEWDRFTLRPFDYLNFVPFHFRHALSQSADMTAVEMLDTLGVPLFTDSIPEEQIWQGFQLFQRGVRWDTLKRAARNPFPASARRFLDEWQAGFELAHGLESEYESELIAKLADPTVRYLDLFSGGFDHIAHLNNSRAAQEGAVLQLDALIGRIHAAIERSPLASSTTLVLVSDHGINTAPGIYSQAFSLVDWFGSRAGGGHHVLTNRHPLTDYKLKGLDPFVTEVITPSPAPSFSGGASNYPTAALDLDGNERAAIYLRDSRLNALHLLASASKKSEDAAGRAYSLALERMQEEIGARLDGLMRFRADLQDIAVSAKSAEAVTKNARRRREQRIRSSLRDADDIAKTFDQFARMGARRIPRRLLGERNSIHRLQNYVTGIAPGGLVFGADGELDEERSFTRIDYFAALTAIAVRNVVQKEVGARPIDLVAVRVPRAALAAALHADDAPGADGVWVYGGADRQLLIVPRTGVSGVELRVIPVGNLRESAAGVLTFEITEWRGGLPLELFEDPALAVPHGERAAWLSGWHTERDWMRAVHSTSQSTAVVGLYAQFARASGEGSAWARREWIESDLLVISNNHWNFNVRNFNSGGNHGSFRRVSTHAVWMMSGAGVEAGRSILEPVDALEVAPTLLKLYNQ